MMIVMVMMIVMDDGDEDSDGDDCRICPEIATKNDVDVEIKSWISFKLSESWWYVVIA